MQAVILAAGAGKRLRPLTNEIPKPMVAVGGEPILKYTLSILPNEVKEVILVVGYRGDVIKDYFGEYFNGIKLNYVRQDEPNGTGHALLCAKQFLNDDYFLLLHADDLYHPDDLANCLQGMPMIITKESPHPERFGVCIVGEKNRLIDIIEKPEHPSTNLVNVGAYLLNREIFDIPQVYLSSGESNLVAQIGLLAKKRPVQVIKARFWHPIGYPEDVEKAEYFIRLPAARRLN